MFCGTYNCKLSEAACRKRYKMASGSNGGGRVANHLHGDLGCSGCETGRKITERFETAQAALERVEARIAENKKEAPMSEDQAGYGNQPAVCKRCGKKKNQSKDFFKSPNAKSGYDGTCKQCRNAAAKDRYRRERQKAGSGKKIEDQKLRRAEAQSDENAWREQLFAGRTELEAAIEALAARELRTFYSQVIYMLQEAASQKEDTWQINSK